MTNIFYINAEEWGYDPMYYTTHLRSDRSYEETTRIIDQIFSVPNREIDIYEVIEAMKAIGYEEIDVEPGTPVIIINTYYDMDNKG